MFWNVLATEQTKVFKRKILWVELGLLALMVASVHVLLYFTVITQSSDSAGREALQQAITWPSGLTSTLGFAAGNALGGMIVVVLVGAVVAQEYAWRTVHLWLSHGVPRLTLVLSKFAAFLLPVVLVPLIALVAGAVITVALGLHINGTVDASGVGLTELGLSLLRTAYTLLPYAALAFLLAVVTRSVVAAVAGGIGYALLLEVVVMQLLSMGSAEFARLQGYLPGGMAASLMQLNEASGRVVVQVGEQTSPPPVLLEPTQAAIGIALYTVVLLGIAAWAFRRQDLTG